LLRLLPVLAGLSAFLVLAWPVLDPDAQLFYRDTGRLYYPLKKYIADRLTHGQLPFWDPWTESGVSLLGQMSPGAFHPWSLLYLALPFDLAFKLNHLLPLPLAGVGIYLLARRLGASPAAATAGGLIFGTSGYLVSQASSNLIYVVGPAGVPIALERFIAFLDKPSRARLVAAAALLALCAYGGEPQSMLMCGVIGSAFAVSRALSRGAGLGRAAYLIAAWGALAAALAAPVALPAAAQLARSTRAAGLSRYELTRFSVSPRRLPGLFVPRAFDDTPELSSSLEESRDISPFEEYFDSAPFASSIYLGSGALLLALFAIRAGRRGRFFLLGAVFLTLAAAGENLGLQPLLHRFVPGFSLFRYAEKQIAFASVLFAVAAALGLDAAFLDARRRRALLILSGASAAAMAAASFLLGARCAAFHEWLLVQGERHSHHAAEAFAAALGPGLWQEAEVLAVVAIAALATLLRPRFPGRALSAAVCGAALVVSGSTQLVTLPVELFHETPPLARTLTGIAGPSAGRWRLYVRPDLDIAAPSLDPKRLAAVVAHEPLRPQYDSLFHIEGCGDYFSSGDANYAALLESASREAFALLTVRFFLIMPRAISTAQAKELGLSQTHFGMWMLTLPPMPRARLLDQVELLPAMSAIGPRLRNVDANRTALLLPRDAAGAASVKRAAGSPGTARLTRPSPERILVVVDATSASVLEVGEHFDPGWLVQLDGKSVAAVAVDGAIEGTVVPAGHHTVELRFRPTGLLPGLIVAILALLIVFVTKRVGSLTFSVTDRV